jgi:diaminohydroxyphosphoribosylaminopyrimidine deaminase/5-amino-6-(5-phosphoribosylamino)uracil reductase
MAFIAPKLLGGKDSPTAVEGANPERMADAFRLRDISVERFGDDICITGYVNADESKGKG